MSRIVIQPLRDRSVRLSVKRSYGTREQPPVRQVKLASYSIKLNSDFLTCRDSYRCGM